METKYKYVIKGIERKRNWSNETVKKRMIKKFGGWEYTEVFYNMYCFLLEKGIGYEFEGDYRPRSIINGLSVKGYATITKLADGTIAIKVIK